MRRSEKERKGLRCNAWHVMLKPPTKWHWKGSQKRRKICTEVCQYSIESMVTAGWQTQLAFDPYFPSYRLPSCEWQARKTVLLVPAWLTAVCWQSYTLTCLPPWPRVHRQMQIESQLWSPLLSVSGLGENNGYLTATDKRLHSLWSAKEKVAHKLIVTTNLLHTSRLAKELLIGATAYLREKHTTGNIPTSFVIMCLSCCFKRHIWGKNTWLQLYAKNIYMHMLLS